MDTHVKVLAALYIVFGILGTLFGIGLWVMLSDEGSRLFAQPPVIT